MASNIYKFETFREKSKFFFKDFPYVDYDILGDGEKQKIVNFLKRFDFRENIRQFGSIYIKWIIRDEDTPQIIADKLYGSTHYYWIVLMLNKMVDPLFDFPLTDTELHKYTVKKYGENAIHDIHHYESVQTGDIADLPDGIIVDSTYTSKVDVDNLEYELKLNDSKRHIYMLKPEYLEEVLDELETILKSKFTRVK